MGVADPSGFSMVLNSALPATFTFLYQRLDALLSRQKTGETVQAETLPEIPVAVVGALELPLRSDDERVSVRFNELEAYALSLGRYQQNPDLITSEDPILLQMLGKLRDALEDIYGQRFTFEGEPRVQSGPFVEQHLGTVAGTAVGMDAKERISGSSSVTTTATTVEAGGSVIGMRAPIIGDSRLPSMAPHIPRIFGNQRELSTMTSPIAESPSTEAVTLAATDASPVPEGIPSSETEPTEESVLAAYVSDLPMTDASEISEPQFDGPAHWGPLPVPDDQVEEQLPVSSDTENEHISTGGASVDMKIEQNYGQAIGQLFEAVKRHSGAALRKEWVEGELKDYVPIGNEAELLNLLRDNRVMVLHAAQPGSGRWTTALRLLSTIQEPQLTIRRIRRESGGSLEMTGLRGHKNTGWILDLRAPDESISEDADLGHELHQSNDLYADGSYLIVLASTRLWERIGRSAVELARTLEPPDSLKLFNALLDSANIASASTWAEKYRQIVEPLRPAQIIAQSRAFASSYRQFKVKKERSPLPEREEDVKEIEEVVRNATSGWMETLAIWHADSDRTSYDRNYLLLAAVYDGAPIDDVHRKIASLAQALGEKGEGAEPLSGQQGPGLVQLAGQINAELLPDGSLRFPGPGFAEAVVRYFWLDRPHLTNAFMKWAVRLSRDLDRPQESQLAEQLAERMVPWVLHQTQATNSISLLRLVASVWSEKKNLEAPAHDLLVMASLDQKIGSRTRKAIGSWADGKETTAALSRTLARVFATLTPAHNQMLGRLCELAASTMEGVPEAVGEGILNLWDNYEFHGILRKTMASWFDAEREQLRQAAASAFLQLALQRDPEGNLTLLSESQTSDWVMRGWRASLEESRPSPLIHRAFTAWLDDAATSGNSREQIFATLAGAVHDTPKEDLRGLRSLNLGRLGERWVSQSAVLERPERDEIRYELDRHTRLADPERPVAPDEEDLPVV